jgi:hypothetical protein
MTGDEELLNDAYWIIYKARAWLAAISYDGIGAASKEWLRRAEQQCLPSRRDANESSEGA